jgi:hypothetical protein
MDLSCKAGARFVQPCIGAKRGTLAVVETISFRYLEYAGVDLELVNFRLLAK